MIEKGNKVKVEYTGTFDDGTVFDTSKHGDHSHPLEFTVGEKQVIKGFDEAVIGMKVGDEKDIHLESAEAYGDINPEMVKTVPRDKLPAEAVEGATLGVGLPNGMQIPAKVIEIKEKEVKIDLNHPLAGKALNFKIKIIDVE